GPRPGHRAHLPELLLLVRGAGGVAAPPPARGRGREGGRPHRHHAHERLPEPRQAPADGHRVEALPRRLGEGEEGAGREGPALGAMPIYEYVCGECEEKFERLVRSWGEPVSCPACASQGG